jgi:hypothetical protein
MLRTITFAANSPLRVCPSTLDFAKFEDVNEMDMLALINALPVIIILERTGKPRLDGRNCHHLHLLEWNALEKYVVQIDCGGGGGDKPLCALLFEVPASVRSIPIRSTKLTFLHELTLFLKVFTFKILICSHFLIN